MDNFQKNLAPNNFYQAQPYSQASVQAYAYSYLSNQQNNPQASNPAYQYWNYYQQNPYGYQNPQGRTNKIENASSHHYNQGNRNIYHKNDNYKNQNQHRQNRHGDPMNKNFKYNQNKQQKVKVDKRDLPENNKFYCEVCDRGFKTDDKYQEHLGTHTTCGINGCKFTAAAKLVEIHFRNFHATGLDKKISNIQTPDDVQKYINERKKNFPTKNNLEKKKQFDQEKSDRGVVLNTREYGKLKNRNKKNFNKFEKKNEQFSDNNNSVNIPRVNEHNNTKRKNKKGSLFSRKMEVLKNRYKKPTLLQKLLADEIRHERNILLQCVRYVVEKNFFEKKPIHLV